jgi:hypothetical protein
MQVDQVKKKCQRSDDRNKSGWFDQIEERVLTHGWNDARRATCQEQKHRSQQKEKAVISSKSRRMLNREFSQLIGGNIRVYTGATSKKKRE